jgi:hypothetical protein
LDLYAQYSELHVTADKLIWSVIFELYGPDVANSLDDIRWENMRQANADSDSDFGAIAAIIIAGRGSTGRTAPRNVAELNAMNKVLMDPLKGATTVQLSMSDGRWPMEEGWFKMERRFGSIKIHFNYSPLLDEFDDFKFK